MIETGRAERGRWVRISWTILGAGERAPQVPADTALLPLVARASGWLDEDEARMGDETTILTAAGRRLRGTLVEIEPASEHGFGRPVEELLVLGPSLRMRLREAESTTAGAGPEAGECADLDPRGPDGAEAGPGAA